MKKRFKLQHERDICIGCGACVAIEPNFWVMNDDGRSDIIGGTHTTPDLQELELDELEENEEAARACPVDCIHIFEGKEKKI